MNAHKSKFSDELLKSAKNPSIAGSDLKNVCELWAKIIAEAGKG